jgi:hypothetical protein
VELVKVNKKFSTIPYNMHYKNKEEEILDLPPS